MPYYSPRDPYNRYAFLRWWCQNQWWVQIVVPCLICAGVIGALLYHWNNENQRQRQDKLFEAQYGYMKTHPPELDPDLDEKAAAWRVIRMKKNDPSMPIPYKKKQLIVKHWKSIIVDMKAEEIQRLHDLLQDQPTKPTDDIEIDISKFDAPWKDDVLLDDIDQNPALEQPASETENITDPAKAQPEDGKNDAAPDLLENKNSSYKGAASEKTIPENDTLQLDSDLNQEKEAEDDPAPKSPAGNDETFDEEPFEVETSEETPASKKTEKSTKKEPSVKSVSYLPTEKTTEVLEPILLDSPDEKTTDDSDAQNASASYLDIDIIEPEHQMNKMGNRSKKDAGKASFSGFDEVVPLEDNFLQQREEFIKKALEERNRKIEEFKKSQDPYQFIPSPWKRNPIVI